MNKPWVWRSHARMWTAFVTGMLFLVLSLSGISMAGRSDSVDCGVVGPHYAEIDCPSGYDAHCWCAVQSFWGKAKCECIKKPKASSSKPKPAPKPAPKPKPEPKCAAPLEECGSGCYNPANQCCCCGEFGCNSKDNSQSQSCYAVCPPT
jgi:hypothetical protein